MIVKFPSIVLIQDLKDYDIMIIGEDKQFMQAFMLFSFKTIILFQIKTQVTNYN